jgi:hypothetical protein
MKRLRRWIDGRAEWCGRNEIRLAALGSSRPYHRLQLGRGETRLCESRSVYNLVLLNSFLEGGQGAVMLCVGGMGLRAGDEVVLDEVFHVE